MKENEKPVLSYEEKKRKRKKIISIAAPIVCAGIVFVVLLTQVIVPGQKLNKAMEMIDAGEYDPAYAMLEEIENKKAIAASKYDRAMERIDAQDYETALALLDGLNYKDSGEKLASTRNQYIKANMGNVAVGDTVSFGSYEQDNNASNGKEAIEWLVLAKEDTRLLVISQYALDCRPYNTRGINVTWETCTLRKWLNGDFLKAAFSDEEKAMIPTVTVSADKNPDYSTNPGNFTQDKVFLLSIMEVNEYFKSDDARRCVPSAYAKANGGWTSSDYTKGGAATGWWWLRSPGFDVNRAACVSSGGGVNSGGYSVDGDNDCVRPAMWIDLSA